MKLDLEHMYDVLKENVYSECECKINMCLSILSREDYSDLWKKCSNYDEEALLSDSYHRTQRSAE